jgi:hypothetical protein
MRPFAKSTVKVDLIQTREKLGQLAILGAFLARDILITAADEDQPGGSQVVFHSRDDQFLESEIAALVAICGVARDEPVEKLLVEVRRLLEKWGYPLEGKPSDARPFGAGVG